MTEDEARAWIVARYGEGRTTSVARFLAMVAEENQRQNIIAPSTVEQLWARHAVDSAQLIGMGSAEGCWIDVGTGGGFPGMIVAILRDPPIVLVEPRKRRAAFLALAAGDLGLTNVAVESVKVEHIDATAAVISARAVASVEKLLQATAHCATPTTRWILPRGRLDPAQLADLRRQQRGKMFHVEHSLTDPDSTILIVEHRR
ncbi:16S rRNA (guanine(527)-N(7))-methyltransferase RsmG [Sphingomonas oligophenolica]|uniref:Ribosomal RNA small subunit methyltransferase G n=1 Tax=Sphingomonas oligophenolica TaxID=301154 RepID=A0A502CSA6_9SPHN|nr:16S rRNA (guanine(527)-N(7))-methyltransferase RsmG [Sphingomonas oligophenolica]TPG15612.1 16S rRNA (guanine(527)-N(7))-methyltransferase RsmG [Sphingomonas oligophenolica]